jgi:hypothetical protein
MLFRIQMPLLPLFAIAFAAGCGDGTGPRAPASPISAAAAAPAVGGGRIAFGFNGTTGPLSLTGGGSYSETGAVAGGGFDCNVAIGAGRFAGCGRGEGTHWSSRELLASFDFPCVAGGPKFHVETGAHAVVLNADFFRTGDGTIPSFTAALVVTDGDIDGDPTNGVQNVWVQGQGCGPAVVHFNG